MAEKLRYDVEVNTRDGVSELERLGKAGKEAGDDISSGFEETESAARQVAAALVAAATDIETALQADKAAADALATALGPELSGRIDTGAAVQELKTLGLTADQVKADADTLGTALKQVDDIKMSAVKSELTTVDNSIRNVGEQGDNSRSVMANLAGNTTQTMFGNLGGTIGDVGMALGQLAEYSAEGNISMGGLAKMAGPMLGLSAALALVSSAQQKIAAEEAFKTEQVDAYKDAIDEVGIGVDAVAERLGKLDDLAPKETEGALENIANLVGQVGDEAVTALTPWESLGGSISNLPAVLADLGFGVQDIARIISGGTPALEDFEETLKRIPEAEGLTGPIIDALTTQQEGYAEALGITTDQLADQAGIQAVAASEAAFYESTLSSMTVALSDLRTENRETAAAWATLMDAQYNGNLRTQESVDLWNQLRETLGLSESAMAELFDQKYADYFADQADATGEATDAATDHTAALQDEADAMQEAADAAKEAADAQRGAVDAVYALEGAQEDLNDARAQYIEDVEEYGEGSVEATRSLRDLRDSAIDVADAEVELARERAKSNRVTYTSVDAIDDENAALLRQAGTLQGPERQAILTHIASVNDIPQDVMTEIATLIDQGKYAEAQALLDDVSGRRDLAIDAEVNQKKATEAKTQIDKIAADQTANIDVNVDTSEAADKIRRLRTLIYGAQQAARRAGDAAVPQSAGPPAGPVAAPTTLVTLNLPRGTRPDDAVRAIDNYARRNGSTRARR